MTESSPSEHPMITNLFDFDKQTRFTAASLATICLTWLSRKGRALNIVYPSSFPYATCSKPKVSLIKIGDKNFSNYFYLTL